MKTFQITTHEYDDRLIRVITDGKFIADVQWVQGTDKYAFDILTEMDANPKLTSWLKGCGIDNLPINYDKLNERIWDWHWLNNDDVKQPRVIKGIEYLWYEGKEVWVNPNTMEVLETLPTTIVLPEDQREIIIKALDMYLSLYNSFNSCPTDTEAYEMHDIRTLIGLMRSEVVISMTPDQVDGFTERHGVDLPSYVNEKGGDK